VGRVTNTGLTERALNTEGCSEVQVSAILNDPASILQELVDLLTSFLLGFHDVICSDPEA
jgi:hypothetical protein